MEALLFPFLLFALVCALCCSWLADEKGYSEGWAFLVGAISGIFGVLVYVGAPDKKTRKLLLATAKFLSNKEEETS